MSNFSHGWALADVAACVLVLASGAARCLAAVLAGAIASKHAGSLAGPVVFAEAWWVTWVQGVGDGLVAALGASAFLKHLVVLSLRLWPAERADAAAAVPQACSLVLRAPCRSSSPSSRPPRACLSVMSRGLDWACVCCRLADESCCHDMAAGACGARGGCGGVPQRS